MRELYHALAPLVEGLALFGELNALLGSSPACSAMLLNVEEVFFAGMKRQMAAVPYENFYGSIRDWICEEREKRDAFANTKHYLETNPARSDCPCVIGFRWVNDLVAQFHSKCSEAREDLDMTLAFLCSYIFDDYDLRR